MLKTHELGLLILAVSLSGQALSDVWYVDKNAAPGGDGTSWSTAFQTIEPAVDAANADGGGEVWVAAETYGEERSGSGGSLEIPQAVQVYGGFNGSGAERDERDWTIHECIIDGSKALAGARADFVVRVEGPDTRLDGVTVLGGSSGVFAKDANLSNCIIRNNEVPGTTLGWGVYAVQATIENCVIRDNGGDGISALSSQVLTSYIARNAASIIEGGGLIRETTFANHANGALYIYPYEGSLNVESSVFEDNIGFRGGAIFFSGTTDYCPYPNPVGTTIFTNCVFTNNEAVVNPSVPGSTGVGGAVYVHTETYNDSCGGEGEGYLVDRNALPYPFDPYWPPLFINCTFTGNRAVTGGALYWKEGDLLLPKQSEPQNMVIGNCIFWDNGAEPIKGEYERLAAVYQGMFTHCIIDYPLTGIDILDLDPRFVDAANGDYRLRADSPAIDRGRDTSTVEFGEVTDDFLGCPRGYDGDGLGAATGDGSDYDIGAYEYVPGCSAEGEGEGQPLHHTADQNADRQINVSELLRIIQFHNTGGFHCAEDPSSTEDGYVPQPGANESCTPHNADYSGVPDWTINLTELLRIIQFFNSSGYHPCEGTEDGFCPGST